MADHQPANAAAQPHGVAEFKHRQSTAVLTSVGQSAAPAQALSAFITPPKHPKSSISVVPSRVRGEGHIGTMKKHSGTLPDPSLNWAFLAPRHISKLPVMSVEDAACGLSTLLGHAHGSLGHGWPLFRTSRRGYGGVEHDFVGAIAFTTAVGAGLTIVSMQLGRKMSPEQLVAHCVRDEVGLAWIGGSVTVDVNSETVYVEGATRAATVVPGIGRAMQVDFASDPVTRSINCTCDGASIADGICIATDMPRNALLYPLVLNSQTTAAVRHVTVDAIHGPVVKPRILQRRSVMRTKPRAHGTETLSQQAASSAPSRCSIAYDNKAASCRSVDKKPSQFTPWVCGADKIRSLPSVSRKTSDMQAHSPMPESQLSAVPVSAAFGTSVQACEATAQVERKTALSIRIPAPPPD